MTKGATIIAVYGPTTKNVERTLDICGEVGFEIEEDESRTSLNGQYYVVPISYCQISTNLQFNQQEDRDADEPICSFGQPVAAEPGEVDQYQQEIDALFELICRFAVDLEASYIPLFDSERRSMDVVPKDRPIAESIDQPPRLGVYSESLLDKLGGAEQLFDSQHWYTAELEKGRTLLIESNSESPWQGWRPPTEAPYIQSATVTEDTQELSGERPTLTDPFAALESGAHGTDVCVAREDITSQFRNDDLQLVRVYVDENRDLRRLDDNTFVRNVVDENLTDHRAVIEAELAAIPPDADEDELMVSALLHDAVPTSFVRLDDPNGQTIASQVMDLDIETNKQELLISLGQAAQHKGESSETLQTIEQALDELTELKDVRRIDDWIEANLL